MNRAATDPLAVMLEARSVALVGASPRPGSLGARMIEEVAKSASAPRQYLVNPRYDEIGGVPCYPTLADLPEAVDLALLAVPDAALEQQLKTAAEAGVRSAVIFGSAVDQDGRAAAADPTRTAGGSALRDRIAAAARDAGMSVCGAGCMGFVNVARGLRAIGYTEPDPLPAGPVALVTHSGSVFSALLRTRRAFGFTVAVSSGQELVTPAAAYARYALTLPETKVLALVLEAIRDGALLRAVLADAAARDVPVVLLAAAPRPRASPWSPPTPAPSRQATAPGRRWRPPTACTASATWPSSRTRWSCSAPAAAPGAADRLLRAGAAAAPARPLCRTWRGPAAVTDGRARDSPPCTTPGSSGRTSRTWRPPSASRSPS